MSEMTIQPCFMNFIAQETLKDIDNTKLTNLIYKQQSQDPGRKISNIGGWQSNLLDIVDIKCIEELKPLVEIVEDRADIIYNYFQFKKFLKPRMSGMWMNINKPRDYNEPHSHSDFLVGVYYINVPDNSGYIEFETPILHHSDVISPFTVETFNEYNSTHFKLYPKSGLLVIFPSWLIHSVSPNDSDSDRLSLAFNIQLINREESKNFDKITEISKTKRQAVPNY